jgi:hypothetical protein
MRLRELRERERASQDQVAQAMGVGPEDVDHIEQVLLRLCEVDTVAEYLKALGYALELVAVDRDNGRTVLT